MTFLHSLCAPKPQLSIDSEKRALSCEKPVVPPMQIFHTEKKRKKETSATTQSICRTTTRKFFFLLRNSVPESEGENGGLTDHPIECRAKKSSS